MAPPVKIPGSAVEGRRDRRKREIRGRVYRAAQDLFLEQGFDRTTVAQIAEAADVVPQTLFNHFQSKQTLLGEITAQVVEYLQQMLEEHFRAPVPTRERLAGFAGAAADQIARTREIARDVLLELIRTESEPGRSPPYLERVHEPFVEMLSEGQRRGEVRAELDPSFMAEMILGVLNATVMHWLADASYPIDQRLRAAAEFAWEAVRQRPS